MTNLFYYKIEVSKGYIPGDKLRVAGQPLKLVIGINYQGRYKKMVDISLLIQEIITFL